MPLFHRQADPEPRHLFELLGIFNAPYHHGIEAQFIGELTNTARRRLVIGTDEIERLALRIEGVGHRVRAGLVERFDDPGLGQLALDVSRPRGAAARVERGEVVIGWIGAIDQNSRKPVPEDLGDAVDPGKRDRQDGDIRNLSRCGDVHPLARQIVVLVFLRIAQAVGDLVASFTPHAPQRAADRTPSNDGDFHQSYPEKRYKG